MGIFEVCSKASLERIRLPEVTLRVRHGGHGPAVLLLHGHPRTHAAWEHVAPVLARDFTVVCPDLRGARDCIALMDALGHDRFAIVAHDRGAYVAFRTAMDYPERIIRLAVLDAVPIREPSTR